MPRLLILDSNPLVHRIFRELVNEIVTGLSVYSSSSMDTWNGSKSVEGFEFVFLDLQFPQLPTDEAIEWALNQFPTQRVLLFSDQEITDENCLEYIAQQGWLLASKQTQFSELILTIRTLFGVDASAKSFKRSRFSSGIGAPGRKELTVRQASVMEFISKGMSVKLVARALDLSPETVKAQMSEIYRRLKAKNMAQAVDLYLAAKRRHAREDSKR